METHEVYMLVEARYAKGIEGPFDRTRAVSMADVVTEHGTATIGDDYPEVFAVVTYNYEKVDESDDPYGDDEGKFLGSTHYSMGNHMLLWDYVFHTPGQFRSFPRWVKANVVGWLYRTGRKIRQKVRVT